MNKENVFGIMKRLIEGLLLKSNPLTKMEEGLDGLDEIEELMLSNVKDDKTVAVKDNSTESNPLNSKLAKISKSVGVIIQQSRSAGAILSQVQNGSADAVSRLISDNKLLSSAQEVDSITSSPKTNVSGAKGHQLLI